MKILPLLYLLAMTYISMVNAQLNIEANGTIWLGEEITLKTPISANTAAITWKSEGKNIACDKSCGGNEDYKITRGNGLSTLWIRNVSWQYRTWTVIENDLETNDFTMDINVKPTIHFEIKPNCDYKIKTTCSKPKADIKCLYGKDLKLTNESEPCNNQSIKLNPPDVKLTHQSTTPGKIKCDVHLDSLLHFTVNKEFECNSAKSCISRIWMELIIGIIITVICLRY